MDTIDLGQKWENSCCAPCSPAKTGEKHYPTMYIETDEELDIPESGTMTIKFVRTRREDSGLGDKKRYCVSIEARKITDIKAGKAAPEKDTGEALDELMEDYEK